MDVFRILTGEKRKLCNLFHLFSLKRQVPILALEFLLLFFFIFALKRYLLAFEIGSWCYQCHHNNIKFWSFEPRNIQEETKSLRVMDTRRTSGGLCFFWGIYQLFHNWVFDFLDYPFLTWFLWGLKGKEDQMVPKFGHGTWIGQGVQVLNDNTPEKLNERV